MRFHFFLSFLARGPSGTLAPKLFSSFRKVGQESEKQINVYKCRSKSLIGACIEALTNSSLGIIENRKRNSSFPRP